MTILIIGFVTFLLSLFFVWLAGSLAHRFGWVASPRADRWHKKPVALYGGVGIFAALVGGLLFFYLTSGAPQHPRLLVGFFSGALVLFGVGFIDDTSHLKPSTKLIGQIIGVSIPVYLGLVFQATPWSALNILITFFWFLAVINAINLMDNMDGLASGVVMIATATFLGVRFVKGGFAVGDPLIPIAVIFLYAVAGFWIVNRYPASIFMGDSGSLLLGFMLAGITMPSPLNSLLGSSSALLSLIVPAVVVSVPLFDTTLVTIGRLWHGVSPTEGGKDHSSHRLVGFGFSEDRAVWLLYGIAAIGGVAAIALTRFPTHSVPLLLLYLVFLILAGVYLNKVKVYRKPALQDTPVRWTPLMRDVLHKRHAVEVLLDFVLISAAYYLAYYLRFEGVLQDHLGIFAQSFPIVVASAVVGFFIAGVYRGLWHFITISDLGRFAGGVLSGVGISVFLIAVLYRFEGYSRAVFIIFGTLQFLFIVGSRLSFRLIDEFIRRRADAVKTKNVVIYGAGQAGKLLLEEWARNPTYGEYSVVAFVDDDTSKRRRVLGGVAIYTPADFIDDVRKRTLVIHEVWISSSHIVPSSVYDFVSGVALSAAAVPHVRKFSLSMGALESGS